MWCDDATDAVSAGAERRPNCSPTSGEVIFHAQSAGVRLIEQQGIAYAKSIAGAMSMRLYAYWWPPVVPPRLWRAWIRP